MDRLKNSDYDYVLPKEQPIPRYFGIKPNYDFIDLDSKKDNDTDVIQVDWFYLLCAEVKELIFKIIIGA